MTSPSNRARGSVIDVREPLATCAAVDEVCEWLSQRPTLDAVAGCLRSLRLVEADLSQAIELLRCHVLVEIGERSLDRVTADTYGSDVEEPF